VTRAEDASAARAVFERALAGLVGHRVTGVAYWDIHRFDDEPATWDYGQWHHAVMGVELATEAGPWTVTWTDTFFPYGVEVLPEPIERQLAPGPAGPRGWAVGDHPYWRTRAGQPVRSAQSFWERIELGPARRSDGTVMAAAEHVDVPVGVRLDFDAGPVWFVAGIPEYPQMDRVFIPGDEIMVVFSSAQMRSIGFPDGEFIHPPNTA
jgi:hypothetical protein